MSLEWIETIKYDAQGLVPAIAQDVRTGAVLMLAYMNKESLRLTVGTRKATYYSRSRSELWVKGETSGHTQKVLGIFYDCDSDAILLKIEQTGVACHTGEYTCFHNKGMDEKMTSVSGSHVIAEDYATIIQRQENPVEGSYTNYLLEKGIDKICKKVGEEATEVVIAAKNNSKEELTYEAADLIYHLLVTMAQVGVTPEMIYAEMENRR